MEMNAPQKRVINLDPDEVRDDTLATLKDEVRHQTDDDIQLDVLGTIVLDAQSDLNSHAVYFSGGGD